VDCDAGGDGDEDDENNYGGHEHLFMFFLPLDRLVSTDTPFACSHQVSWLAY
jgi:hypothetical protein